MKRADRGFIMVQALIIIAVLIAFMAMLVADEHAALSAEQSRLAERRADAAAQAGIARAMAVLQAANPDIVTLQDDWALQGDSGLDAFQFGQDDTTYQMQIVDASSLINLNNLTTATKTTGVTTGTTGTGTTGTTGTTSAGAGASASTLEPQFALLDLPLDQAQYDSLLDWIQPSTTARADGAKDDYYNSLQTPYNTKLNPLTTVDELLLVDNWTAQTLYQSPSNWSGDEAATGASSSVTLPTDVNGNTLPLASLFTVDSGSPNVQADGSARINLSSRTVNAQSLSQLGISRNLATAIINARPTSFESLFTNGTLLRDGLNQNIEQQLLNAVTFSTATRIQGKINLNTASEAVLETVPTVSSDIADAIITQQGAGFQTLGQLTSVSGLTGSRLGDVADSFTIGSDTWIVRSYGKSGNYGVSYEAVVRVTSGQVQVINWNRINVTGIPTWWGWDTQTGTTTMDAGVNQ